MRTLLAIAACWMAWAATAPAEQRQVEFGMVLKAEGGGFRNLLGTVTVPADWPNQQRVRVVKQDLPPGATVTFKDTEDIGRQMAVKVPWLAAGAEARAVVTFAVETLIPPPLTQDVSRFTPPNPRSLDRKVALHLAPSPKIESDQPQVRKASEEALGNAKNAWEKVQAIHVWVNKNIVSAGDLENVQTCLQTLELRHGVCAEKNSLAVAMLRSAGFPARLVRIPGHCYYEVYLLDEAGEGHWLTADASANPAITPNGCSAAGSLILQKGDNVTIINPTTKRRTKGRFLGETVTGLPQTRGAQLQFQPITPALKAAPHTPAPTGSSAATE